MCVWVGALTEVEGHRGVVVCFPVSDEVDLVLPLLLLQPVFGAAVVTHAAAAQYEDDRPNQPKPYSEWRIKMEMEKKNDCLLVIVKLSQKVTNWPKREKMFYCTSLWLILHKMPAASTNTGDHILPTSGSDKVKHSHACILSACMCCIMNFIEQYQFSRHWQVQSCSYLLDKSTTDL